MKIILTIIAIGLISACSHNAKVVKNERNYLKKQDFWEGADKVDSKAITKAMQAGMDSYQQHQQNNRNIQSNFEKNQQQRQKQFEQQANDFKQQAYERQKQEEQKQREVQRQREIYLAKLAEEKEQEQKRIQLEKEKKAAEERARQAELEKQRKIAEEKRQKEIAKQEQIRAEDEYLRKLRDGGKLAAKNCFGDHRVGGRLPRIKPKLVGCVDLIFRARCKDDTAFRYSGTIKNFVNFDMGCLGESVSIEPKLGCKAEDYVVEVADVTRCQ